MNEWMFSLEVKQILNSFLPSQSILGYQTAKPIRYKDFQFPLIEN